MKISVGRRALRRQIGLAMALALAIQTLVAADFTISDIRVEGLQRISPGTVFNSLPVSVGDRVSDRVTAAVIRALYRTGFFDDVAVERDGSVLVITVAERPAVAEIEITGNKDVKAEDLKKGLRDIGLAEGRVFNPSLLDRIELELKRQYFARGKYAVQIESTVSPLVRNRVAVRIDIVEGVTSRIKQVNLIGNESFSEDDLLDLFKLGSRRWHSFYSKNDQYSKQKLAGDLETLRSFYLDRGHIKFEIKSTQVSISPDKQDIYITIVIDEGGLYRINDIRLAGETTIPVERLFPLIHLRRGDTFSRSETTASSERISRLLADEGYAFANVNTIPEIDEDDQTVKVTFFIDPGRRVNVRRVNMTGNTKTRDVVLRREMQQLEAAWLSTDLVRKSQNRLQRLGFFDDVSIETPAVPGSADQVDVNVSVTERPSGNFMAGVGYSQSQGILFNTSITQNNFLGTGKRVSLAVNTSQSNRQYLLSYTNPYYTVDGISRGFSLSYREYDFDELTGADYSTDVGAAGLTFGLPISNTSKAGFGLRYQYTKFHAGTDSDLAQEFVADEGNTFHDLVLTASYSRDSRDRAIFPTRGTSQSLVGEITIPGSDLQYYRLSYRDRRYVPLTSRFVFLLRSDIGYGDGYADTQSLPFFENYYAGGPRTVRGWEDSSLGPRETSGDLDAVGGNFKLTGSLELFAPPPVGGQFEKTLRVGAFLDFGNVWSIEETDLVEPTGFDLGDLRYSTGFSLSWMSPVGALALSYGFPLNAEDGDDTQAFQFSLGQVF